MTVIETAFGLVYVVVVLCLEQRSFASSAYKLRRSEALPARLFEECVR